MSTTSSRTSWVVPATAVALGAVMFVGFAANDDLRSGVASSAVMLGYAVLLAVGGRSQYLRLLRGEHDDERLAAVNGRALAVTGAVLVWAVVLGLLQALLRGVDPHPFSLLASIGGVVYLGSLALLRWRG